MSQYHCVHPRIYLASVNPLPQTTSQHSSPPTDSWDIIVSFGPFHRNLTPAFSNFAKMALRESKHFSLLACLIATSLTTPYGSMPAHAAFWHLTPSTARSLHARVAIIHLVCETHGLDVNAGESARFRCVGGKESETALAVIHADKVKDVAGLRRCVRLKVLTLSACSERR
jgi:uncharacterized ferritin-like protein (DUF455 family)